MSKKKTQRDSRPLKTKTCKNCKKKKPDTPKYFSRRRTVCKTCMSKAYAINHLGVNWGQLQFLNKTAADALGSCTPVKEDDIEFKADQEVVRHALCHLIVAAEANMTYEGLLEKAPIPTKAWDEITKRKYAGSHAWRPLQQAGILLVDDYQKDDKKCRRFVLKRSFLTAFYRSCLDSAKKRDHQQYNGVTANESTRTMSTRIYKDSKHPVYDHQGRGNWALQALKLFAGAKIPFDLKAVLKGADAHYRRVRELEALGQATDRDYARLMITQEVAATLLNRSRGADLYTPCLKIQSSGRQYEVGRGLQGAPRWMKRLAFKKLQVQGKIFNYDLKRAHLGFALLFARAFNGHESDKLVNKGATKLWSMPADDLIDFMDKMCYRLDKYSLAKIDEKHLAKLESYCKTDKHKKIIHSEMRAKGCPAGDEKVILIGILYGMKATGIKAKVGDAYVKVGIATRWLSAIVKQLNARLYLMLRHCAIACRHYDTNKGEYYGVPKFVSRNLRIRAIPGGVQVENAVGLTETVMDAEGNWLKDADGRSWDESRIWAHIYQGMEVNFISCLAVLCHQAGIKPLSNQYDGIITDKEIPEDLALKAAKLTGLGHYADIIEKKFSDEPMPYRKKITGEEGKIG